MFVIYLNGKTLKTFTPNSCNLNYSLRKFGGKHLDFSACGMILLPKKLF